VSGRSDESLMAAPVEYDVIVAVAHPQGDIEAMLSLDSPREFG
jgi:hypothetical protein